MPPPEAVQSQRANLGCRLARPAKEQRDQRRGKDWKEPKWRLTTGFTSREACEGHETPAVGLWSCGMSRLGNLERQKALGQGRGAVAAHWKQVSRGGEGALEPERWWSQGSSEAQRAL